MNSQEIKKYIIEVLKQGFPNKKTLDKLSTSDNSNLLFDGKEIAGGGITRVTLWEGEIREVGSTGECSQSIENFDYLLMYYKPDYEPGSVSANERKLSLEDVSTLTNYSDNSFSYVYFYSRFLRGTFTDSKHFKVLFNEYYAGQTISLVKIVGIKLSPPVMINS